MRFLSLIFFSFLLACQSSPQKSKFTDAELGQLIVVGFRGTDINRESDIVKEFRERNLGGVILFEQDKSTGEEVRNVESATQLLGLSSRIVANSSTPPFISIVQEGGVNSQLTPQKGFPTTLSASQLGKINREDTTRHYARTMAQEFMVVGVNTNFAPVLDIASESSTAEQKESSFGNSAEMVQKHASWVLDEFNTEAILSVPKYFPGKGSFTGTTWNGIPDVSSSWKSDEIKPYIKLFEDFEIHAVMVGNIFNSQIDEEYPAVLSDKTINGLLRDSLGFSGVVFSENMQNEALRNQYDLESIIENSLNAGVDVLLFPNNETYEENIPSRVINIIHKLVLEERISEETIEKAIARVAKLKKDVIEELCTCLN